MAALDQISTTRQSTAAPRKHFAITPHDTNELTAVTQAIYVGVAGHIAVVLPDGSNSEVYKNVPVGWFPCAAKIVKSTGTTATDLVGGWGG